MGIDDKTKLLDHSRGRLFKQIINWIIIIISAEFLRHLFISGLFLVDGSERQAKS